MARVDEVSEALLRAAGDVLAAEGPGALTVRRIAHAAEQQRVRVIKFDQVRAHPRRDGTDPPTTGLRAAG